MPSATTTVIWLVEGPGADPPEGFGDLIAAFTVRRQADSLVTQLKRDDPYHNQYVAVRQVRAYTSIKRWQAALRQIALHPRPCWR